MALAPIKMTHEQRLAWIALEGWEPATAPTGYRGLRHERYPNRIMVIVIVRGARSEFKQACLYESEHIQAASIEFNKEHTELFMRKIRWLNGEDR